MRHVVAGIIISLSALSLPAAAAPDLVLVNGHVWTETPDRPEVEAVAITGTLVSAVGGSAAIRKLADSHTRIVDLAGRRVLPGFNDSHVHLLDGGQSLIGVQLGEADSRTELRDRVKAFAAGTASGAWLRNGNWDHERWQPATLPDRQLIDEACGDHPALLWRLDGHMALANSLALKLAGIDRNTADPPGGAIEHDSTGEPTGILKDAATTLVEKVMPPFSEQERRVALDAAMKEAAAHGVTSVQSMADTPDDVTQPEALRSLTALAREGRLTVRVYAAMPLRQWRNLADIGVTAGFGDDQLRIGNTKAFADGALGSATAWMNAPFADQPTQSGLASADLLQQEAFFQAMKGADRAGLQLSIHAIGDHADHVILDLYERLLRENGPRDRRPRIEHAQHLDPADYGRFKTLGVIASMQPYHAIDDGRWAERRLGAERIRSSYAWRSLLDHGAVLAFGSDWPVAPLDPVLGIYAAATRRTLDGKNPTGWVPDQRISVKQAIHAYTVGSAFAEGMETRKGSLAAGKLADLVVLSDDILTMAPERIIDAKVAMTIFDGRIVYERK